MSIRAPDRNRSLLEHGLLDIYQHTPGPRKKKARERNETENIPTSVEDREGVSGAWAVSPWMMLETPRVSLCSFPSTPVCCSERAY